MEGYSLIKLWLFYSILMVNDVLVASWSYRSGIIHKYICISKWFIRDPELRLQPVKDIK